MTDTHADTVLTVEVDGGPLFYERSGPRGGTPVIGAPGLTSHRSAWEPTVALLGDVDFAAADLRGRGDSRNLPGPCSMSQHAADLVHLADALDAEKVVIAGHSMGAAVAITFAAEHPDRCAGIVLVDGGLRPPPPAPGSDPADNVPNLALALSRLTMTFASVQENRDFWRAHPATGPYWNAAIERYVDTDLVGEAPELRPSSVAERVQEDILDLLGGAALSDPLDQVSCRLIALRAPRGLVDDRALYVEGWMQELASTRPYMEVREVDDVNHYTILLEDRAAAEVARAIRDVLEAP